jgi:hypothetical protein
LGIRVTDQKITTIEIGADHVIDPVSARAADPDNEYSGREFLNFRRLHFDTDHGLISPKVCLFACAGFGMKRMAVRSVCKFVKSEK